MNLAQQFFCCPNCGKEMLGKICMKNVRELMCSEACGQNWERKYRDMLLGRDGALARLEQLKEGK